MLFIYLILQKIASHKLSGNGEGNHVIGENGQEYYSVIDRANFITRPGYAFTLYIFWLLSEDCGILDDVFIDISGL